MLADDQQVAAALAAEDGGGRVLDGHGRAEPGLRRTRGGSGQPARASSSFKQRVLGGDRPARCPRRRSAAEPDRLRCRASSLDASRRYSSRRCVGQPDDLEGVVAFEQAVGVVVDRLAGPGQQAGGRVVFAQDQVGVGLAALQGDAHGHLADACCGPGE